MQKSKHKIPNTYFYFSLIFFVLLFLIRFSEYFYLTVNHEIQHVFKNQLVGWVKDCIVLSPWLLAAFLSHALISFLSDKLANTFLLIIFSIFFTIHFALTRYFTYTLKLLDVSLFGNSFNEALFTLKTTSVGSLSYLLLIISALIPTIFYYFMHKYRVLIRFKYYLIFTIAFFVVLSIFIRTPSAIGIDIQVAQKANKSIYFYRDYFKTIHSKQNIIVNIKEKDVQIFQQNFNGKKFINNQYPLLYKTDNTKDILSKYFTKPDTLPNIVIIIVEGLADKFLRSYNGLTLMPYTAELADKSLYWSNFLCTSERSFAAVPSITGSLPHAERGFSIQERIPYHFSLYNILKENGYQTSFFYGQWRWFHRKDAFCKKNNVDLFVDAGIYNKKYTKVIVPVTDYFWGYCDLDLFNQYLEVIDTLPKKPRLDVFFTGSMHPPYALTKEENYVKRLNEMVSGSQVSQQNKSFHITNRTIIQSIIYFDDVLKYFIDKMSERADFKNTLFIITGDHPVTDLPFDNPLLRYNVPLIIYSPMLNEPSHFKSLNSHFDIAPSVLTYLENQFFIKIPEFLTFLGNGLDTSEFFESDSYVPIMGDNRKIENLVNGTIYGSENATYSISDGLQTELLTNEINVNKIKNDLLLFNKINDYISWENKLLPDSVYFSFLNYNLICSADLSHNIKSNEMYFDINKYSLPKVPALTIDFSTEIINDSGSDKIPLIVYEFINEKGTTVKWTANSLKRSGDNGLIQRKYCDLHQTYIFHPDSIPTELKVYIWNEKKVNYEIGQCKLDVYTTD